MKKFLLLLFLFSLHVLNAKEETLGEPNVFLSLRETNNENLLLNDLIDRGVICRQGKDRELRPLFVNLQATIEEWLASQLKAGKLRKAVGLIHTPLPPTPLCTSGEVSPTLAASSVLNDEKSLQTVKRRVSIVRSFLKEGGILYAAFPQKNWNLRSEKEQKVFLSLLEQFPKNLFPLPFAQDFFPDEMTGASYLFQDASGQWFAFSIKSLQAVNPKENSTWALWLGPLKNPIIKERMREITSFFLPLTGHPFFPISID